MALAVSEEGVNIGCCVGLGVGGGGSVSVAVGVINGVEGADVGDGVQVGVSGVLMGGTVSSRR